MQQCIANQPITRACMHMAWKQRVRPVLQAQLNSSTSVFGFFYFSKSGLSTLICPPWPAGGSTGFGRAYRNRLRGSWGVVDVADVCAAAQHLVGQGQVDPKRLCIEGGSAGGYTTLAALAFRRVVYKGSKNIS